MVFKLVLLAACILAVRGGVVVQPQAYASAPVASQYLQPGAPIATSYRIDRPLQQQLNPAPVLRAGPVAHAQTISIGNAPIARVSTPLAVAQIPAPIATPLVKNIAPLVAKGGVVNEDYDPNPQYTFSYDVQDGLTGDNKNQIESRNGDVVQGSYSLIDPDGTRRIVEYTADPINGFNAVVRREPLGKAVLAAPPTTIAKVATPLATPFALSAPAVAKIAAPSAYSSPLTISNTVYHQ